MLDRCSCIREGSVTRVHNCLGSYRMLLGWFVGRSFFLGRCLPGKSLMLLSMLLCLAKGLVSRIHFSTSKRLCSLETSAQSHTTSVELNCMDVVLQARGRQRCCNKGRFRSGRCEECGYSGDIIVHVDRLRMELEELICSIGRLSSMGRPWL